MLSESNIVRKENLQSCYNTLLEDINKPRLAPASSSSSKSKVTVSERERRNADRQSTLVYIAVELEIHSAQR